MSNIKKLMMSAAGGGEALNVEDVFSTYLYEGTGSTSNTIINGIDLAGEGGMVWAKSRNASYKHAVADTERGIEWTLHTNETSADREYPSFYGVVSSYNSDGFTLNADNSGAYFFNGPYEYASWTFRKAPKFFDVVTFTMDGSNPATVSHNLGSVPGVIVIKRLDSSGGGAWGVWHKDLTAYSYGLFLNETNAQSDYVGYLNSLPTATDFVARNRGYNGTFVAYLFAHNDGDGEFGPDGDADIIKCGSFTYSNGLEVNVGFEPQWLLYKQASTTGHWRIVDNMRGWGVPSTEKFLYPSLTNAEASGGQIDLTSTGFRVHDAGTGDYIYMAIRRGTKVPESGTEVFAVNNGDGVSSEPGLISGFPVDFGFYKFAPYSSDHVAWNRLTQGKSLSLNSTAAEINATQAYFDYMDGMGTVAYSTLLYSWMWKRAPNFFDVVAYTGDGTTARAIPHNLGVAPEMMIHKRRNATNDWYVPDFQNSQLLILNGNYAAFNTSILANYYGSGDGSSGGAGSLVTPDASTFTVTPNNNVNASGDTYIAYLFASLDGVSKVGSYTGNGSSQTIDCGFTSGARFVLIKRTDSTGDWYIWDTERGIVTGNDPHLSLNTTAAEVTSDDSIDPASSGFIVNQLAATNINVSSATYIFYAIA